MPDESRDLSTISPADVEAVSPRWKPRRRASDRRRERVRNRQTTMGATTDLGLQVWLISRLGSDHYVREDNDAGRLAGTQKH